MIEPADAADELDAFPPALRALLDAELGVGNSIAEIGHSHPAPPRGAYVRMAHPLGTRVPEDLDAYDRNGSLWSTEVTDDDRAYWILGAPLPPPPEADMDAIRAAADSTWSPPSSPTPAVPPTRDPAPREPAPDVAPTSAWERFHASIPLDHERWHEGIGIDLDALDDLDPDERVRAEVVLTAGTLTWREIEALAHLRTPGVEPALRGVLRDGRLDARLAVLTHAPDLLTADEIDALLVDGLAEASSLDGLSRLLDHIDRHHPPVVRDALARAARDLDGEVAVHYAALLDLLEGPATSSFDWDHRPFYLLFWAEPGSPERAEVWGELCARTGREPGWV